MRGNFLGETWFLALGDILAIGVVTLIGFARHGEILSSGLRPLTTFVPLCLVWLLIAPFIGAYHPARASDVRQLWRPVVAALVAAPFAAMLRSVLLQTPIQPVFVLVLGLASALGLLIWRGIFILLLTRYRIADG